MHTHKNTTLIAHTQKHNFDSNLYIAAAKVLFALLYFTQQELRNALHNCNTTIPNFVLPCLCGCLACLYHISNTNIMLKHWTRCVNHCRNTELNVWSLLSVTTGCSFHVLWTQSCFITTYTLAISASDSCTVTSQANLISYADGSLQHTCNSMSLKCTLAHTKTSSKIHLNTFAASYLNTQGLNNSCLKSPASTLVDLTFQSRALRSFSLNQLRNLSL